MIGDEAVGGTVATPDQDIVDEIGWLWGWRWTIMRSGQNEILEERDDRRI